MTTQRRNELAVGLLLVAAAVLAAWMALRAGGRGSFGREIDVVALFDDASGLQEGAAVQVAGVQVGRVTDLSVDFDKARVGLALDAAAGLRSDVQARVRARSVLGEKYVELVPHDRQAPPLRDGAIITDTRGQLDIDQLVTELGPLVAALDPERTGAALDAVAAAVNADPERPSRMAEQAEALLSDLRELAAEARALVAETRQGVSEARALARRGGPVLDRADRALADLEQAAGELPAASSELPSVLDEARAALADARGLLGDLDAQSELLEKVLSNLSQIDKWELRRLLREEGILVRVREHEVVPPEEPPPGD